MKKLLLCGMAIMMAGTMAMGCSKAADPNDAAKQADQLLGGGNCVQSLQVWGSLFTPLAGGSLSDDAKAKIKTQVADLKKGVPADVGQAMQTLADSVQNAKNPQDVQTLMSSAEFSKANTTVNNYFNTECSKVGK